jgi:hypothetical protein
LLELMNKHSRVDTWSDLQLGVVQLGYPTLPKLGGLYLCINSNKLKPFFELGRVIRSTNRAVTNSPLRM